MGHPAINEALRAAATEVLARREFELVHTEAAGPKHNPLLTVYIDKPGGITLDDCGSVSREVEGILDADERVPATYVLEVSSPGIERGLYSLDDFRKFIGSDVRMRLNMPLDGRRNITGIIRDVDGDTVVIDEGKETDLRVDFEQIKKANLKVDLDNEFKS